MSCAGHAQVPNPPTTPEVASGIHLSPTATLSVLDQAVDGPKLVDLHATEISFDYHAGSNFARAQVFGNQHRTVDLKGAAASQTIESHQPTFYFRLPLDNADIARSQITLIRFAVNKDHRTVLAFSNNVFGGGLKRNVDVVQVDKTDLDGGYLRITPATRLDAGEYGFMLMPKDPSLYSEIAYDFSISKSPAKGDGK